MSTLRNANMPKPETDNSLLPRGVPSIKGRKKSIISNGNMIVTGK